MSNFSKQPLEQLKLIYPTLTDEEFEEYIILQDDGDGEVYIAKWEHPTLAEPTEKQITDTKPVGDVIATKMEAAGTLNADLMTEFKKLDETTRKKWYKNGTKAAIVEALKDKELTIARTIIDEAQATGQETQIKANMLSKLDDLLN